MKKISVLFFGGLGNQLFQLALAKTLKEKWINSEVDFIDLTSYASVKREWALDYLGEKAKKINKFDYFILKVKRFINQKLIRLGISKNFFNIFNEKQYNNLNSKKLKNNSTIIDGYWQSEKFFFEIRTSIKKTYLDYRKNLKNIYEDSETVALHIRLGDFVDFNSSRKEHFVCDFNWYLKAINYLYSKNNNLKFVIFTNDHFYLKEKFIFPSYINYYISKEKNEAHIDMLYMSFCNHFIISNSSYSWWASYLGENENSIIIAPKYWYPNQLTVKLGIYRSNWILL